MVEINGLLTIVKKRTLSNVVFMLSFTNASVVGSGVVVPPPIFRDTKKDEEEALARRYNRRNLFNKELVFEFTRDPGLLGQYYNLRKNEFDAVLGVNYINGESDCDRDGHIMVVRIGNFCVGGARLNIKSPRRPNLLPMEIKDFRLEKHFPYLQHKQMSYGQVSGVAILPEFRFGDVSREMLRRIINKSVAMNLHMLFAICPLINSRLYKQEFVGLGWKETKIHLGIELPSYPTLEEVKLYLMSSVIDKSLWPENISIDANANKAEMLSV